MKGRGIAFIKGVYPVRNNAPLPPPGQRPSLRGRSPSGAEPGPAAVAGLRAHCRLIPTGFNASLGFESKRLEFLTAFAPDGSRNIDTKFMHDHFIFAKKSLAVTTFTMLLIWSLKK